MVPSTSDDKTAVYDPHDYDEVPIDEGAMLTRSPLGATLSAPPALVESTVPGPAPADPIPETEDDGLYSVVSQSTCNIIYPDLSTLVPMIANILSWLFLKTKFFLRSLVVEMVKIFHPSPSKISKFYYCCQMYQYAIFCTCVYKSLLSHSVHTRTCTWL